jgi:hypothetical protein
VTNGSAVKPSAAIPVRGIAFGGDTGVARVDLSADGGQTWRDTTLGPDTGRYSFRQWTTEVTAPPSGSLRLMVRCTNTNEVAQPAEPTWNPAGFMRNVIESVQLNVA